MTVSLVDALAIHWLVAVRGNGPVVHLVARDKKTGGATPNVRALCGDQGELDRFGRYRWTRVREAGKRHCMACFTASLSTKNQTSMRVDWG